MKKLVAVLSSEHDQMYTDAAKMVAEIAKQGKYWVLVAQWLECLDCNDVIPRSWVHFFK